MDRKYIERPKMSDEERKRRHIEANKKYNKENYKQFKVNLKPDDYSMIDDYCKNNKISKAKFILEACKFYIENHSE